jgi:two-component system OmpR family sensor kinase
MGNSTSFRAALARRMALSALLLFVSIGSASVLALRSILYRQLDNTLLHLAEVEAKAGAATSSSDFEFHEGVLLSAHPGSAAELTRYAQLWTSDGRPLVRSQNLDADLELPNDALQAARHGEIGWATHKWGRLPIRSVVYPLELVGAAHGVHLLQVAAPTDPVLSTLAQFSLLVAALVVLAAAAAYGMGWRLAGVALRPTREITEQAEAIEAGTLSERITAHAGVAEFSRLVTVLNAMLNRLDRSFRSQRRFTADASHELRAPLTVLRGDIEVALKRPRTPQEYRETLVRCREEVVRLSQLANDLLVLARSDAGLPLEQPNDIELYGLATQVAERYRAVASDRGVALQVTGSEVMVRGNVALLERAIGNLIDNAVKYCPSGGAVRIEVSSQPDATFEIVDDGPGITAEDVPHLFTRFFRGDPARTPAEGSGGLGLAIAHAAAEAHGGRLEFFGNAPGAKFRLSLPLLESESSRITHKLVLDGIRTHA